MATKRLIDANALIDWLTKPTGFRCNCEDCPDIDCLHCVIEDAIKTAPTVDAVEVVRCKECKNRDDITGECKHPRAVGWDVIIPEDNDFCSYGERKDNDISAGEGHSGIC